MFPEQLKKILKLVKETGERVIIFDPSAPDDSYVLMDFDSYAELSSKLKVLNKKLTTNTLTKGVVNKSESSVEPVVNKAESSINTATLVKPKNLTEEDLTDKINREISKWKNKDSESSLAEENPPKKAWQIPGTVKDKAQEIA